MIDDQEKRDLMADLTEMMISMNLEPILLVVRDEEDNVSTASPFEVADQRGILIKAADSLARNKYRLESVKRKGEDKADE